MEEVWPAHTFGRGETFYAGHSRSGSRKDRFFFFFFFKPKTTSSSCIMRCACCEGLGWPGCHRALVDNSKMAGIEEESFAFRGDSGDM